MELWVVKIPDSIDGWYGHRRPANILPAPLMRLRNWILELPPIFSVPLEMSQILFVLVNIYKSLFISDNTHNTLKYIIMGCVFFTLLLESPLVTNFAVLYVTVLLCAIISMFASLSNLNIAVLFLPICMCFSQPLSLLMDIIYIIRFAAYSVETGSDEFVNQTAVYSIVSSLILFLLDWEIGSFDSVTITVVLILLHFVASLVYLFWFGYDNLALRSEWSRFIFFQLGINAIIKHFYKNEKLTYSFQIFKNLYRRKKAV